MKRKLQLKSILLTAALFVGASAWGQTTAFSQDFTDKGSTYPADYGFVAGTCSGKQSATVTGGVFTSLVGASKDDGGANQNNYTDYTASFTPIGTGNVVTFTCTWSPGGATGSGKSTLALTDDSGNVVLELRKGSGGSTNYHFYVNGEDVKTLGSGNNADVYNVSATINLSTQKVTALTIGSIYTLSEAISFTATTLSKINFYQKNKANWVNTATLDNIVVSYEAAASTANVTYKYEDTSGTDLSPLKADVVNSEEVGANISDLITSALTASFKNNDESIRYDYSTFTCSDATVPAGGTTVTLKFAPKAKYTYTVRALDGSSNILNANIASGYVYAGDNATVAYPQYVLAGTTLYEIANNGSGDYYRKSITPDADAYVYDLTYSKGTVSNIVYYTEAESITGYTAYGYTNRASNGNIAHSSGAYKDVTSLTPGKYQVYTRSLRGNNNSHKLYVKCGEEVVGDFDVAQGTNQLKNTDEFTVYTTSTLSVASEGGSTAGLDWIYVKKTGELATIKTTGTTFSSAYPIDCANLPSGVTAYKVTTMSASQVTAVEVTEAVAANTGLILKVTSAGNYNIPVAATGTDISASNLLKAAVTTTTVTADQAYGLSDGVFKKLQAGDVPAGKAYLLASSISSAPELSIDFGGATGISATLMNNERVNSEIYNIQGQRVAQPTKGLYIVNGKKVIIK